LSLQPGNSLLDVGFGSGKQLVEYIKLVGPSGRVVGVDGKAAVAYVTRLLGSNHPNVHLIEGDMDRLHEYFDSGEPFDRVASCFAVSYSTNARKLIQDYRKLLKNQGRLLLVGSTDGNAEELLDIQRRVGEVPRSYTDGRAFMVAVAEPLLREQFRNVKAYTFINPLTFPDWKSLMDYWSATELYSPSIEAKIGEEFKAVFIRKQPFTITKHVMGILAEKR
jgi:ubiquinone/menaquinone biosynthesis C-methylase UbiE